MEPNAASVGRFHCIIFPYLSSFSSSSFSDFSTKIFYLHLSDSC